MNHAAGLDLIAYEDPVFYDRLERARVQATDRLVMIQAVGRLVQQAITTITLAVSIMGVSPWVMLLLIAGVIPAFLGGCRLALLVDAKNFRQTAVRRRLDCLGGHALLLTDLLAYCGVQRLIGSKPNPLPAPRPNVQGIEFRNVSFRYPGNWRLVLDHINFQGRPTERLALICENGEGKTSIVK